MQELGKIVFIAGVCIALAGLVLWKLGLPSWLGRLPGDIFIRKGSATFYFPILTCLLISVLLTLLSWFFRK